MTFETMSRMRDSRTPSDLQDVVLDFVRGIGGTYMLAGVMPPTGASRKEQTDHVLLDVWPSEWSRRYFSSGYLFRDPTIRLVQQGVPSFQWQDLNTLAIMNSHERRTMNEARDFRLRDGLTYSFLTPECTAIGFSIAAEVLDVSPSALQSIQLVAAFALGCVLAQTGREVGRDRVQLSRRQHEALLWASEGLTNDDIGDRMGVSSHTADMHMRLVREKLGVRSSIHAVAEAFRRGLIR